MVIDSRQKRCVFCNEYAAPLVQFGWGHGGCDPHFFRWGDIICHVSPNFFFRFCLWRSFKNKILRELLFMLDVTHSHVDVETAGVVSLDSVSFSIVASIILYLTFYKFLETTKDGLLLLSDILPCVV